MHVATSNILYGASVQIRGSTNQTNQSKYSSKYHRLEDRTSTSNWPVSKSEWWRDIKDLSHCCAGCFRSIEKYRNLLEEWMVRGRERTGHWVGEWASEWNNNQTNGKKDLRAGIMNMNSAYNMVVRRYPLKEMSKQTAVKRWNLTNVSKLFHAKEEVCLKIKEFPAACEKKAALLVSQLVFY